LVGGSIATTKTPFICSLRKHADYR